MPSDLSLTGRRAIVTGGTRGLGRAIAARLAREGADIAVIDHPDAVAAYEGQWRCFPLDLSLEGSEDRLAEIAAALDSADILIANAGIVPPWRGFDALDGAEWARVMRVNVWGVASAIGAFSGLLAASGRGAVVATASINGYRAHPRQALYTASKHAVIGVVRAAALDLGPRGVRVNAVAPGPVATEALKGRVAARSAAVGQDPEAALAAMAADTALGRLATEEDVARVAYFLASDLSAGVTGTVLPVEAGLD